MPARWAATIEPTVSAKRVLTTSVNASGQGAHSLCEKSAKPATTVATLLRGISPLQRVLWTQLGGRLRKRMLRHRDGARIKECELALVVGPRENDKASNDNCRECACGHHDRHVFARISMASKIWFVVWQRHGGVLVG